MNLTPFVKVQLTIFSILTVIALVVMGLYFVRLPELAGIGRYTVSVELRTSGGLYKTANVTYRGETVGRVESVSLSRGLVVAHLSMESDVKIPVDVTANVHSRSAIGEQYIDLVPSSRRGPYLADKSVIPESRTSVPAEIGPLLDTVNNALAAIPPDQLKTLIDEANKAFGNTGPELGKLLDSSNLLVTDANQNLAPTLKLIDDLVPFLNSQAVTSDAIRRWATGLADLSGQAKRVDPSIRGLLSNGSATANESTALFRDLKLTLPMLVSNLTSLNQVAATYNAAIEQILVLLPASESFAETVSVPLADSTKRAFLAFNLTSLNSPGVCTTGFLPPSQRRGGGPVDAPPRTDKPLYCAVPQDSPIAIRGARNYPCVGKPGKRAPTVEICKSDKQYVPQGTNPWVGPPMPISDNPLGPQAEKYQNTGAQPASATSGPGVSNAFYDPTTGLYVGPDGKTYRQAQVTADQPKGVMAWQNMLTS